MGGFAWERAYRCMCGVDQHARAAFLRRRHSRKTNEGPNKPHPANCVATRGVTAPSPMHAMTGFFFPSCRISRHIRSDASASPPGESTRSTTATVPLSFARALWCGGGGGGDFVGGRVGRWVSMCGVQQPARSTTAAVPLSFERALWCGGGGGAKRLWLGGRGCCVCVGACRRAAPPRRCTRHDTTRGWGCRPHAPTHPPELGDDRVGRDAAAAGAGRLACGGGRARGGRRGGHEALEGPRSRAFWSQARSHQIASNHPSDHDRLPPQIAHSPRMAPLARSTAMRFLPSRPKVPRRTAAYLRSPTWRGWKCGEGRGGEGVRRAG